MSPELSAAIGAAIDAAEGGRFVVRERVPVPGGDIAINLRLADGQRRYFVKIQSVDHAQLTAEIDGLQALARCAAIVVPRVITYGVVGDAGFLVLEWLDLQHRASDARADVDLAEAIADLHAIVYPRYGWQRDNFIGSTPQQNAWDDDWGAWGDWADFFLTRRLAPQLTLAAERGQPQLRSGFQKISDEVLTRLAAHSPPASLLHGDLWAGNVGWVQGKPALFDPAVYAGDGETDLAMAALFGGFSRSFFDSYLALRPSDDDRRWREVLYQLYHVLNHVNLFGGDYPRQAARLIETLAND